MMKCWIAVKGKFCLLFGVALLLPPILWATERPLDAVIVMDSSGSMAINDPNRLRVPAAKLFSSLLGDQDRLGVVSFSDQGYPVVYLTPLTSGRKRTQVMSAIDKVSSKGVYTNLDDALQKAIDMLSDPSSVNRRQVIVLLTDGKMDVGNPREDQVLIKKIQTDTLATLRKHKIRVYTLAFTHNSDLALLELIGRQTNARFTVADSTKDLHRIFTEIFEASKEPNMLPMPGGVFVADESLTEVTLVASKAAPETFIKLLSPSDVEYTQSSTADNMKWATYEHFDLITINHPQAGRWRLLSSEDTSKAYVLTDMELMTSLKDVEVHVGSKVGIEVWLSRGDARVEDKKLLTATHFQASLQGIDSEDTTIDLQAPDGLSVEQSIFQGVLEVPKTGVFELQLTARGETFERQRRIQIKVIAANEAIVQDYELPSPSVDAKRSALDPQQISAPREQVSEAVEMPLKEQPIAPDSTKKNPPVNHSDPPRKKTVTADEQQIEHRVVRDIGLARIDTGTQGMTILIIFISVNILLALSVGVVLYISKRHARAPSHETDNEARN